MRPTIVAWLAAHGLPGWLVPDYVVLVGVAGVLGAFVTVRRARRAGADVAMEAHALALGYLAALLGGYAFEWVRALPAAIAAWSLSPILGAGRAAYGGLLAGVLVPVLYLRARRAPALPFLDRLTAALGITFALVRTGCFLAGCDYGKPTAGPFGVRFPAESIAALDHAARGWVPLHARSLPVHPTELYEAALGLVASAAAWLAGGKRRGTAFATWIAVDAAGRFAIEALRGDDDRGSYLGLSTAQCVSIALLAVAALLVRHLRGRPARIPFVAAAATLALLVAARPAVAQQTGDPFCNLPQVVCRPGPGAPPPTPPPTPTATATPTPAAPIFHHPPRSEPPPPTVVTLRLATAGALPIARPAVPSGAILELSGRYRFITGAHSRIELGPELRWLSNKEADQYTVGLDMEVDIGLSRTNRVEGVLALVPGYSWVAFRSPFFQGTTAWGMRLEAGVQGLLGNHVLLGGSPLAFNVLSDESIGVITTWEPKLWLAVTY